MRRVCRRRTRLDSSRRVTIFLKSRHEWGQSPVIRFLACFASPVPRLTVLALSSRNGILKLKVLMIRVVVLMRLLIADFPVSRQSFLPLALLPLSLGDSCFRGNGLLLFRPRWSARRGHGRLIVPGGWGGRVRLGSSNLRRTGHLSLLTILSRAKLTGRSPRFYF